MGSDPSSYTCQTPNPLSSLELLLSPKSGPAPTKECQRPYSVRRTRLSFEGQALDTFVSDRLEWEVVRTTSVERPVHSVARSPGVRLSTSFRVTKPGTGVKAEEVLPTTSWGGFRYRRQRYTRPSPVVQSASPLLVS